MLIALVAATFVVGAPPAKAAYPGANGKIAFDRDGDIYSVNADGSGAKRLANGAWSRQYSQPVWSPTGGKIAFVGEPTVAGQTEIYVMNADGSVKTRLTNNTDFDGAPHWSPDGTKIAFVRAVSGGDYEIFVMNADGSGEQPLTDNGAQEGSPAWSPDGTKIVFSSYRDGDWEIYVMNANGTDQANLTNFPTAWEYHPDWSPDGTKIAFTTTRDGAEGGEEVYVMDADGSDQTNLSADPAIDRGAAWSPDGTKIVFESGREFGGGCEQCGLFLMNSDGTGVTEVVSWAGFPDWQPLHVVLTVSKSKVVYKQSVRVTAHLIWYETSSNLVVSIYKTPDAGSKTLVTSATVDAAGDLSATVALTKKTTFSVGWTGDAEHPAGGEAAPIIVNVYPLVTGTLSGHYGTSGAYRLYHYTSSCPSSGTGCPTYTAKVTPNHRGQYVYFKLQLYVSGAWRTVLSFRQRLNSESKRKVTFVYGSRDVIGIPTRAQVRFPGDADHLERKSAWSYFRVTT